MSTGHAAYHHAGPKWLGEERRIGGPEAGLVWGLATTFGVWLVAILTGYGVVMGAGILIGGSGVVGSAQHSAGRRPGHERQLMKPRSRAAKLTIFGRISGMSVALTPIQEASVAAYCSTEVVGISRPLPASAGPFEASSG